MEGLQPLHQRVAGIGFEIDYAAMNAIKNASRWIKQLKLLGKWPAPKRALATASA